MAAKGRQMARKTVVQDVPQVWIDLMAELRKIRVAKGITTREVAGKIGVTMFVVSKWERGDRAIHPHDLMAILDMYGIELTFKERQE